MHACTTAFFLARSRKARAEVSNWPRSVRVSFLSFLLFIINRLKFERTICNISLSFADYSQLRKNRGFSEERKEGLIFIGRGRGMLI